MQQHLDVLVKGSEYEERFRFLAESENLFNSLAALRRTLWDMRASIYQLERLYEEIRDNKADVGCLREEINSIAERFDLHMAQLKKIEPS